MELRNTSTEYGLLAKALHWLIAAGILALIALGLADEMLVHKSVGLLVFGLMTVRLIWRFMTPVPAHPPGVPAVQKTIATLVHWGLYLVVFAQLFAGMMATATGGRALPFFGLFSIPLPVAEDEDAHHFWEEIHEVVWIVIVVLIGVHIIGAIYNHVVLKNDVLRRMTSGTRRGG